MRTCPKCKESKPLTTENFYKNKSEVGGFQYTCKVCHKDHYKRKDNQRWYKPEVNLKYKNSRYHNDPAYKLLHQLRVRLNQYLKVGRQDKNISFLGCSSEEWVVYLQERFDGNMNWENHGTYWEIDHIIPLSKGGSFHYTNTQPLTLQENRTKSNKVI
jgi:hypothetical protein